MSISPTATSYNPVSTYATGHGTALKWRVPTGASAKRTGRRSATLPTDHGATARAESATTPARTKTSRGFNLRVVDTSARSDHSQHGTKPRTCWTTAWRRALPIASNTTHTSRTSIWATAGTCRTRPRSRLPAQPTVNNSRFGQRRMCNSRRDPDRRGRQRRRLPADHPRRQFTNVINGNGTQTPTSLIYDAPRGHAQTLAQFTLAAALSTTITLDFYEAGGGDSVELSILNSGVAAHNPATFQTLRDGVFGWTLLPPSPVITIPSIRLHARDQHRRRRRR